MFELHRLAGDKEHIKGRIKSSINEQRTDLSVKSQFFEALCHIYAENKEEIAEYEDKCKQQKEFVYQVGRNLTKTEVLLYEKRLKVVTETERR